MFEVRNIMRTDVVTTKKDTPIQEAIRLIVLNNITGMPVINDDMTLAGVISEKDVLNLLYDYNDDDGSIATEKDVQLDWQDDLAKMCKYLMKNASKNEVVDLLYNCGDNSCTVADFMTKDIISFDQDADLIDICKCFMQHHFRRVPILSEGKLVGIITRKDIIAHICNCQDFFKYGLCKKAINV